MSDGENAISGATVVLGTNSQTSDANGEATFENVAYGEYTLAVSKTGYVTSTTSVNVDATHNEFEVTLTEDVYDVTITVDDGTDAISGATVVIGETTKTTGDDGTATFDDLTTGTKSVTVTKDGYVSNTSNINVDATHTAFTISLDALATRDLSFSIYEITVEPNHSPIQDATVTIGDKTGTTGSAGGCTVSGITDGEHTVTVTATGYTDVTETITVSSESTSFEIRMYAS